MSRLRAKRIQEQVFILLLLHLTADLGDYFAESADNSMTEKLSHLSEKNFKNTPVDSLDVNFEEGKQLVK